LGVEYDDEYAAQEVFQLLKVPWEWYTPTSTYDVVITKNGHLPEAGNVIDLADNDLIKKIADTLNEGASPVTVHRSVRSIWMHCARR